MKGFLNFQFEIANMDVKVHGILLKMPLPSNLQADKIIMFINPEKDIDKLYPMNASKLLLNNECFVPCIPFAVLELIKFYYIKTNGTKVLILGRSNIVGKPLAN